MQVFGGSHESRCPPSSSSQALPHPILSHSHFSFEELRVHSDNGSPAPHQHEDVDEVDGVLASRRRGSGVTMEETARREGEILGMKKNIVHMLKRKSCDLT